MRIVSIGGRLAGPYFVLLRKRQYFAHCLTVVERNRSFDRFGRGAVFSEATMPAPAAAQASGRP